PRIIFNLTDSPLPEDKRVAGSGSLAQVRGDLRALEAMGAPYVILDTFTGDVEATRDPEPAWRMLEAAARRLAGLGRPAVRRSREPAWRMREAAAERLVDLGRGAVR